MRSLLLDRVTSLTPPERALGVKCCALSEDYLGDHFPGYLAMPGPLVLEALSQLGAVLLEATMRQKGRDDLHAQLVAADQVRFRLAVRPGDRLTLEVLGVSANEDGGKVRGIARLERVVVAEAELVFSMTQVQNPQFIARRRETLNLWLHGIVA